MCCMSVRLRVVCPSVVCLSVVALSGCATITPIVTAPPFVAQERQQETLSSDGAEALAEEAVRDYLAVSAAIAAAGGADYSAIDTVVSAAWRAEEVAGFEAISALGVEHRGAPAVTKIEVTAVAGIHRVTEATVHVCTSTYDVEVLDGDGEVLPVEPTVQLLTVYVVPLKGRFVVDGVEPWEDTTWCDSTE